MTIPKSAPPGIWTRGAHEVSLARLYALRAVYLLFAVGGFFDTLPALLNHSPTERHLFLAVKGGLWIMCMIGFLYPLKMLPVLLFEIIWKLVWLLFIGLPQWFSGVGSPRLGEDMIMVGLIPIVLGPLLLPWGYIWRHYVRAPTERWR